MVVLFNNGTNADLDVDEINMDLKMLHASITCLTFLCDFPLLGNS
jgi:hypothetical protein